MINVEFSYITFHILGCIDKTQLLNLSLNKFQKPQTYSVAFEIVYNQTNYTAIFKVINT